MGPTNVALVNLFRADQSLRDAESRLDAVTKNVRIQERRINDLSEKLRLAQSKLREAQTQSGSLDLDLKSRDAHIEKLRTQQQTAKNNKEYQTFLIEINTAKVDRSKVEEQTLKTMEQVETLQNEVKTLAASVEAEQAKLAQMRNEVGDRAASVQAEIDRLGPERESAAAAVPPNALNMFNRMAEAHDGEAMAPITRPDKRREEYVCGGCNMEMAVDVYNRLHTRDEVIVCSSCKRLLYIPTDLTPEHAVNKPKEKRAPRAPKTVPAAMTRQSSAFDVLDSMTPEEDEAAKPAEAAPAEQQGEPPAQA